MQGILEKSPRLGHRYKWWVWKHSWDFIFWSLCSFHQHSLSVNVLVAMTRRKPFGDWICGRGPQFGDLYLAVMYCLLTVGEITICI